MKLRVILLAQTQGENSYEHDYGKRWHDNLLQRLGQGPGRHVFARMAAEFGCMGRPTAVPRPEWFPRDCARPAWPRPLEPGLVRERHEWVRRRSRSCH